MTANEFAKGDISGVGVLDVLLGQDIAWTQFVDHTIIVIPKLVFIGAEMI